MVAWESWEGKDGREEYNYLYFKTDQVGNFLSIYKEFKRQKNSKN